MVNSAASARTAEGDEQYCLDGMVGTYGAVDSDGTITQGGYSTHSSSTRTSSVRPRGPERTPPRRCCAPASPRTRRSHWDAGPGKKVAVVGLGGLGHMAVKIAHAMGAEVTVLSQSLKKQEDGLRLGADHYYATSDPDTFESARRVLRPDHQHRQRQDRRQRLPRAPRRQRVARQRGRPGRAPEPQRVRAAHQPSVVLRLDDPLLPAPGRERSGCGPGDRRSSPLDLRPESLFGLRARKISSCKTSFAQGQGAAPGTSPWPWLSVGPHGSMPHSERSAQRRARVRH